MASTVRAFLDEEAAAWRPFEALDDLTDEQLEARVADAHGWSGRDVIAHVVAWLDDAIEVAREMHAGGTGEARERSRAAFAARGDDINAEIQATWGGLAVAEVRERARAMRAELHAGLAAVPDAVWVENAEDASFLHVYTVQHYEEHLDDLAAILAEARS
jgi:hypothetical protein